MLHQRHKVWEILHEITNTKEKDEIKSKHPELGYRDHHLESSGEQSGMGSASQQKLWKWNKTLSPYHRPHR